MGDRLTDTPESKIQNIYGKSENARFAILTTLPFNFCIRFETMETNNIIKEVGGCIFYLLYVTLCNINDVR